MYNQHLLKIEHTVAVYQAILQEPLRTLTTTPRLEKAPVYLLARCPFCQHPNTEKLDTYSLREWHLSISSHAIGEIVSHCAHFALAQAFVNFHDNEPPDLRRTFPPEVPHVIGYLLEEGLAQAVIHALPICRITADQFIPAYTAFLMTYFTQHNPSEVRDRVIGFNVEYLEEGVKVDLIDPPRGNEHWYDLAAYVGRGLLWWIDASDPGLPIRTRDVAAFPYKDIHGRMWSHQFLPYAGPDYRYKGPRR